MPNYFGIPDTSPTRYVGPFADLIPIKMFPRRPLMTDKKYPVGQVALLGKDPSTGSQGELWYLAYFDSSGNATWQQLTGASVSGIERLETDDGPTGVGPDGFGVVTISGGTGITTSGQDPSTTVTISAAPAVPTTFTTDSGPATPVANNLNVVGGSGIQTSGSGDTLTITLTGGGAAVLEFDVQSNTAPGTDPVVPSGAGAVTISGAAVAAHSTPIETHSRAANAFNIEVQYAAAASSSTATSSGICHFDSGDFSVDASGFVTLDGTVMQCADATADVNPMSPNIWYTVNSAGSVTLTLPSTASTCDFFGVIRKGTGAVSIAQQAGQTIHYNVVDTTTGAGGSLDSENQWDVILLKTVTANTDFVVVQSSGAWVAN